ncbi:MAG: 3-hydroxyacyl-ACP dehydratase FabZ [Desulfobacteraceae bacterium]|nr:MAG: 3-hydroxyacyl-ACP dehydratase FabZ [Desulfobacteraceae bacterium]
MIKLPLQYQDIVKLLPHRYPFLFVDGVTEVELGRRVVGFKNVTANEPFFMGHFPDNPIMPGVLILEAMGQVGGILARLTVQEEQNRAGNEILLFMAIDKAKFRKPVVPGDQLIFELEVLRKGSRIWKLAGKASVRGELAAEAELMASISKNEME